jgi:alkanesulfonate monooxygenase SsuD/methylene tetrahydromethanopterin reductase-like flavin-dependent oxidoreductase (luciferase family)
MHPERFDVIQASLDEGFAKRDAKRRPKDEFEIAPTIAVIVGKDLDACRAPLKQSLALYIGGMGAREKNFYGEYIRRVGFEAEAEKIQTLFLAGKRQEAVHAVTDAMVDTLHLVGSPERIRDRFQAWKGSKVTTLIVGAQQPEALRLIAELALA